MQKEYIFKLTNEGKNPAKIQQLLQQRFSQEALHRTTIYKWSAQAKIGVDINDKGEQRRKKPDEQLLIRIHQILDDEPFSSTRSIARTLNENNMIIYRYMTIYLKKVFRLSRWVPHVLDQ